MLARVELMMNQFISVLSLSTLFLQMATKIKIDEIRAVGMKIKDEVSIVIAKLDASKQPAIFIFLIMNKSLKIKREIKTLKNIFDIKSIKY